MSITRLSESYAVSGQISPEQIAQIAVAGFVTIICNRPDNEEPGQPSFAEIAVACEQAGLALHHVPVTGMPMSADAIAEHRRIIEVSDGQVLAYCGSGHRSTIIWQASA